MRRLFQLFGVTTSVLCGIVLSVHSEDLARVTGDRVNVRGGPSLDSEVVIHLQRDEQVSVVDWGTGRGATGAVGGWAKIRLPSDTPVWVYAPFVDGARRIVRSDRLNVRAGPGLNFSVLGVLEKGASVDSIRTLDDWMEITAPTNTYAYVSTQYLRQTPPPVDSAPVVARKAPEPAPAVPIVQASAPTAPQTPAPMVASGAAVASPVPAVPVATPTVAAATPPPPVPESRKRIVRREGLVRPTVSIQAPTSYELRSIYGAIRLNFLLPASPQINIARFRGQRVIVAGEEQIEPRWPNLPMIEVQTIRLAP